MKINSQSKVTMHTVNGAQVVPASQGARRATEDAGAAIDSTVPPGIDSEVVAALAPQKRGPKIDPGRAEGQQIAQLMRDNERLKSRLDRALLVIEVQKKVSTLLGLASRDDSSEIA
jgi:transposase